MIWVVLFRRTLRPGYDGDPQVIDRAPVVGGGRPCLRTQFAGLLLQRWPALVGTVRPQLMHTLGHAVPRHRPSGGTCQHGEAQQKHQRKTERKKKKTGQLLGMHAW